MSSIYKIVIYIGFVICNYLFNGIPNYRSIVGYTTTDSYIYK